MTMGMTMLRNTIGDDQRNRNGMTIAIEYVSILSWNILLSDRAIGSKVNVTIV
jgi:hypothetical protein